MSPLQWAIKALPGKREFWVADGWMVLCGSTIRYFNKKTHYKYTYKPIENKKVEDLVPPVEAGWFKECVAHCHKIGHPKTFLVPWPCPVNYTHFRIMEMRFIPFAIRGAPDEYTWLFYRHYSCHCDADCIKCKRGGEKNEERSSNHAVLHRPAI